MLLQPEVLGWEQGPRVRFSGLGEGEGRQFIGAGHYSPFQPQTLHVCAEMQLLQYCSFALLCTVHIVESL